MSGYTKVTPASFAERLKAGKYKNSTAAKRAIAKCALSNKDKGKCLIAIDKHFDSTAKAPAKKKVTKRKVQKPAKKGKVRASTAKKAVKKAAKKKKSAKKKAAARRPARRRASRSNHKPKDPQPFDSNQEELSRISLSKERVGTLTQAIKAMQMAKEVNPDLDTTRGTQAAQDALTGVVEEVSQQMQQPSLPAGIDPKVAERFLASQGAAVPPPGTPDPTQA
jgi:hypothetical protein